MSLEAMPWFGYVKNEYGAEEIQNQDGESLGFQIGEVKFWTCGPRVYTIAQQAINEYDLGQMLGDLGLTPAFDQLTGSTGDNIIENGARLCYLSHGQGRSHADNIAHLRKVGHNSVFRHATLTIGIAFASRGFTHELVRHAAGTAYSQVSSRYVDALRMGLTVPEVFLADSDLLDRYIHATMTALDAYSQSMDIVEADFHRQGFVGVQAKKLARGACRSMLPIAISQTLQMTLNADSARHILSMRGSEHAEMEIRRFAVELAQVCKANWPVLMEDVEICYDDTTVRVWSKEEV